MSNGAIAEIKEKFAGKWKNDRSECFEDFLREVGVNFVVRKMAGLSRPVIEIKVDEEENVTIIMNAGFMTKQDTFKLGEEFHTEWQGTKCKALVTYDDGKITMMSTPEDDKIKPQRTTREILGEELLLTMYIGDVVCKRYFKRLPE